MVSSYYMILFHITGRRVLFLGAIDVGLSVCLSVGSWFSVSVRESVRRNGPIHFNYRSQHSSSGSGSGYACRVSHCRFSCAYRLQHKILVCERLSFASSNLD